MEKIDRSTCDDALQRLNDYIDRELTPHELRQVRKHIALCAHCAETFALEAETLQQIRATLEQIWAPRHLMAAISDAITRDGG